MAVPPRAPTALHVQLPPDLPEDGAEAGRCLVDLHCLRDEWQVAQGRELSPEKVQMASGQPALLQAGSARLCLPRVCSAVADNVGHSEAELLRHFGHSRPCGPQEHGLRAGG